MINLKYSSEGEGWFIRNVVLVSVLMWVLITAASAGVVTSTFSCTSDNGTMTHYSYFKEPRLEESSYSKGYKTGSMNYLVNGEIDFTDEFGYYDGQIDAAHPPYADHNSSVYHRQYVNFTGEKGISEFYAKGFYPNNRAVSAWKKIRYDDLNYVKYSGVMHLSGASRIQGNGRSPSYAGTYDLGESRRSSRINVTAEADMGARPPAKTDNDYEFRYTANVTDGIIEIKDATAWTNRTVSRNIDWEQDALIRGDNIHITNDLIAENMSYPGAGIDEGWLSCCIGGGEAYKQDYEKSLVPLAGFYCDDDDKCYIGRDDDKWPDTGVYNTLKPNQVTANLIRNHECMLDTTTGALRCTAPPKYEKLQCNYSYCPGFECIYQFGNYSEDTSGAKKPGGPGGGQVPADVIEPLEEFLNNSVTVEKVYKEAYSTSDRAVYNIGVTYAPADRKGNLTNVNVTDLLPEGFNYTEGNSKLENGDKFEPAYDKNSSSLTWTIQRLEHDKTLWIIVTFSIAKSADKNANKAYASWKAEDGTMQKSRRVGVSQE